MRHPAGLVLFPELQRRGEGPRSTVSTQPSGRPPSGGRARTPRYLVLHLPAFALERCGYAADELAACVDEVRSATRLVSLTPAARAEGLREGMTAAEARALVPAVHLETRDLAAEIEDRRALLGALLGYTDRLGPWADGDAVLEISTTAHLFGGEDGLAAEVRRRAEELGHTCGVAVADDPLAAAAIAAWSAEDVVVPEGQGASALAPLPLAALHPSEALADSLEVLGIRRIGTWAQLDPASVAGRFGAEGVRLHRIARGHAASILPWDPPDLGPVSERVVLGGPTITLEPLHFVLKGLLVRIAEGLAARDAMAVRLALHLVLERGPSHVMRVGVGRPTRDPGRLEGVVRARLERVRLDAPAIELLVEVEEDTVEQVWQPGLLDRTEVAEELPDLVARLADALGPGTLAGPVLRESWLPEEAWARRDFQLGLPLPRPPVHRKADVDPVAEQRLYEHDGPRPRPSLLLSTPERMEAQDRGGRPVRVRRDGQWWPVREAEGPERLEGAWWREDGGYQRDYWVIGLAGATAWCFRDEQGRWWLHGWFD